MKNLLILVATIAAANFATADNSCKANPRIEKAAQKAVSHINDSIAEMKGVPGLASVEAADVETPCDGLWASRALGFAVVQPFYSASCGIVYSFSSEADLKAFAKTAMALSYNNIIAQTVIKKGAGNSGVATPNDMEVINLPVCAKVK